MTGLLGRYGEPLVLGAVAGFISGLFGVGGGVVMVPGLVLWFGLGPHKAHATAVAAIVTAAAAGMTPFAVNGDVEWAAVLVLIVGGALGAVAGAGLVGRVSAPVLTKGFVVLLLVTAVRMAV